MSTAILIITLVSSAYSGNQFNMDFTGSWPFGVCFDTEVNSAGTTVFCSMGGGVYILDVSNSSSPVIISDKIRCQSSARELCFDESAEMLYISALDSGLEIWDVQDLQNPVRRGIFTIGGSSYGVAASGTNICLGHTTGLFVIDASDPSSPSVIGFAPLAVVPWRIRVSGNYAYIAGLWGGFHIVDITDPSSPAAVGSISFTGTTEDVAFFGNHVLVANSSIAILVLDVSDPTSPTVVGSSSAPCTAQGIQVSNGLAYIAGNSGGLYIFDLSTLSHPPLLGTCSTPGVADNVAVAGDHAYLCDDSGMSIIDTASPTSPAIVSSVDGQGYTYGLAISGNYAVSTGLNREMTVLDITDPSSPEHIFSGDYFQASYAAAVSNGFLFVLEKDSGLRVYDFSNPFNPTIISFCDPEGTHWDMEASGDRVFIASEDFGIYSIRVSSSGIPSVEGHNALTGHKAWRIALSGQSAFIKGTDEVLRVDVSNPADPQLTGVYSTTLSCQNVCAVGDIAYIATGTELQVVDFSNSANPVLTGTFNLGNQAVQVAVHDNHAYVTQENQGIRILNISNPSSIWETGYYDTGHQFTDIFTNGEFLYMAAHDNGIQIYSDNGEGISGESTEPNGIFYVSPNPSQGNASFNFQLQSPSEVEIRIFDVSGRQVSHQTLEYSSAGEHQLSVNSLPPGLYFASMKTSSCDSSTRFVVTCSN